MFDLVRLARNAAPSKLPGTGAAQALPARNSAGAKPTVLVGVLPALVNTAGLGAVALVSGLPRESLPRIMNPAAVPLTDAARFVNPL